MTIWILAILLIAAVALCGWRQGGIRAAFSFAGILFGMLLAALVGKIFYWLLPHVGVVDPVYIWAWAPVLGFVVVSILFKVAAFKVHTKVDIFYRYKAGDLKLALWKRLNARLGICVGLLNGALYFLLVCFLIFNLSYWTAQAATDKKTPSALIRLVNRMGSDLQSTGFARPASAVYNLPPSFYQMADLAGFLVQNPQVALRVANYPGLTSLWQRDDMQPLVTDANLNTFLSSDATLGEILNEAPVQDLLKNKQLSTVVLGAVETNLNDFTNYLQTGNSAKYDGENLLGRWQLNVEVSLAWLWQSQPKMQAAEMLAIRGLWTKAYGQTTLLLTGDNQAFVFNLPRFKSQPGQAPELQNWKGDWSADGTNYTLHVTFTGEDKFMEATAKTLRLSLKDGHNLLIFDRMH